MASGFKDAFAAARKAGKKEFTWNGKSYNTELKETVRPKARAKAEKGPMPRPVSGEAAPKKSDFSKLKDNIESSRRAREAARKDKKAAKVASAVSPMARPTNESEGRAHLGRNRPAGLKKRGQ